MLPQSAVLVTAPIVPDQQQALTELLVTMNLVPGFADPDNALVPFGQFDRLHFARFLILQDPVPDEITVHGLPPSPWLPMLAFFADCDGTADDFLNDMASRCEAGLRRIFAHCRGFTAGTDLLDWMRRHQTPIAANYVNWIGRTVRQIREEAALFRALSGWLDANGSELAGHAPRDIHRRLSAFVAEQRRAGALALSPPEPAPPGWYWHNLVHAVTVPVVLTAALPLLLAYLPFFLLLLRRHETTDPEINTPPDLARRTAIAAFEDHDVSNPYIVIGYLKPGPFRRSLAVFLLWLVNYAARHIYRRGRLARVRTIHFARWVFINDSKQVFFASTYDGSLDSYMDDFINKVGWGLNVLFSNSVGYPRTNWLLRDGAADELKFKYDLFRHQVPVQVWYKAYPGLTLFDLFRNSKVRAGIEARHMSDRQIRDWLDLL
ncbi:MAG: hypothetical protein JSS43_28480 [Proteobacteria bacterium]|nr:hypothetical protein [Pseudomonadota bacterium]